MATAERSRIRSVVQVLQINEVNFLIIRRALPVKKKGFKISFASEQFLFILLFSL